MLSAYNGSVADRLGLVLCGTVVRSTTKLLSKAKELSKKKEYYVGV